MSDDSGDAADSLGVARRVLNRETITGEGASPAATAAGLQRACGAVIAHLRDSMGVDGCEALLARAVARTEPDHPTVRSVFRGNGLDILVNDILASIETHGVAAVTAAIEAVLAALIDILSRLIGEDMAIRLIDQGGPQLRRGDGARNP